jgi:hypothetical protein
LFDFERYADEDFGAEKSGFVEQAHRPADGKMEKSFVNFQQQHPTYDGGKAAKSMCHRLQQYKSNRYIRCVVVRKDFAKIYLTHTCGNRYRVQQRDQMLASIIETSGLLPGHQFAGTDAAYDSPEPSSPVVRRGRNRFDHDYGGYGAHSAEQVPGQRIQRSQGSDEGYPLSGGFGFSLADPALNANGPSGQSQPVRITPPVVNHSDLHLLSPATGKLSQSIEEDGSCVHSSGSGAHSEVGGELGPLPPYDSRPRPTTTLKSVTKQAPTPADHVEMSNISAMRGSAFPQRMSAFRAYGAAGANRSLIESGYSMRRSVLRGGNPSRDNLPSVLLSILRQENIDYENDFYWMAQFQADRRRDPVGLEKSIVSTPIGRMRRAVSGGGGSSGMIGEMSPVMTRPYSQESLPPGAFASNPGDTLSPSVSASGMESPRAATGAFLHPPNRVAPLPDFPTFQDHDSDSPPGFAYSPRSHAAGGSGTHPGSYWGSTSGSEADAHPVGAFTGLPMRPPQFRPAPASRRPGSNLGAVAESEDTEV